LYDYIQNKYQPQYNFWKDYHRLPSTMLSNGKREWLLDPGSLTARLIKASNNQFAVNVLAQQWSYATLSESRLLGIPHRHLCLIREVFLICNNQPWVYARSVLPCSSLTGKLRHLQHFGNQPLGQLLFTTPSMKRSPFQIILTTSKQLDNHRGLLDSISNSQSLWGRRSRFELFGKPLIVSEFFLPAFQA